MMLSVLFSAALLANGVNGHGRLQVPKTRKHTIVGYDTYENDPVNFGTNLPATTYPKFSCRNDPPTSANGSLRPTQTTVTAGQSMDVQWSLSANHIGDCAMYVSYDYDFKGDGGLSAMRWFKIANWRNCKSLDDQTHQITVPSWLPAGRAVFRWDWYALHVWPGIEFYAQCADVTVTGSAQSLASPNDVPAYSIMGVYPETGDTAPGFRNEYDSNPWDGMTGPPCACRESTENGCEYTASIEATIGFIVQPTLSGVAACGASPGTGSPVAPPSSPPPTAPVATPTNAPVVTGDGGCAEVWGKCGGAGWTGPTCCPAGHFCNLQDEWYSQCIPGTGPAPTPEPTLAAPNATPIAAPTPTPTIATPEPTPAPVAPQPAPTPAPVESPVAAPTEASGCADPVPVWGTCGGMYPYYVGSTCCATGNYCFKQSQWYSQCIPNGTAGTSG